MTVINSEKIKKRDRISSIKMNFLKWVRINKLLFITKTLIITLTILNYFLYLSLINYSPNYLIFINILIVGVSLNILTVMEKKRFFIFGICGYIISFIGIIFLLLITFINNIINIGNIFPSDILTLLSMILYWLIIIIMLLEIFELVVIIIKRKSLVKKEDRITAVRNIKTAILNMSIKFTRLLISEIVEETNIYDKNLIRDIIKNMIQNNEVYAQYFSNSDSIVFNQEANIEEIDKLMAQYKQWEFDENSKI